MSKSMRATTVVRKLLGVTQLVVERVFFEGITLVLDVRPSWRLPRCGECCLPAPGYDEYPVRTWRHLALGLVPFVLQYAPRRVECPRCGILT